MDYIVNLKLAQNDVIALINLEDIRKDNIIPLLLTQGNKTKKDYLFDTFIPEWGDFQFMVDVARCNQNDLTSEYNIHHDLHNSADSYKSKFDFFMC